MQPARRTLRTTALALGLATAVTLGTFGGPALDTAVQSAAADETASAAPAAGSASADDAQARAEKSGDSVEVLSLRDERSTTVANPDGTFTTTQYVQPVRTKVDGAWKDIDTTLVEGRNGTWAPRAALSTMAFSGGGDRTFATIEKDGRSLGFQWPDALPEPDVDGPTATYPDVLPGVDLQVTAGAEGFSHLLVVKTARAAADPALDALRLAVDSTGVDLEETADGGVSASDSDTGGEIFEAPQPLMWDSSTTPHDDAPAEPTVSPSPSAPADGAASDGTDVTPPEGAQVADVSVDLSGNGLTLSPDQALLTGDDTVYPVYIDPVVKTANRTGWTMVSSYWSGTSFWKFGDDEGVGRCPADVSYTCSSTSDVKRQFFAIPTAGFEGKDIVSAEFAVTMVHTYSTSGKEVQLARVNSTGASAISSSTDWNNQPASKETLASQSPTNPAGSCTTTNQNVRFNVKSTVQKAADSGWDTTTFRLKAGSESDYSYWKRFCGNAHLEVTYNRPPLQPAMNDLTMSPGGSCEYGNATGHYVSDVPVLKATVKDYDHNDNPGLSESLKAQFEVFWTKDGTYYEHTATTAAKSTTGTGQTGSASFKYTVGDDVSGDGEAGFTIPQNVTVGWAVRGSDGTAWGPWSLDGSATRCEFIYDSTVPKAPVITSADYPDDDAWHAGVGDYGSFTFDSASADVASYKYRFKGESWKTVPAQSPGGPATVRWMPPDEGTMTVEATAVDSAGNAQQTANSYVFLVDDGRAPAAGWTLGDARGSAAATGTSGSPAAAAGPGVAFGAAGPLGTTDTAAAFDGTANAYLDAGAPVVDTSHSFSVSAWVDLPQEPTDNVTVVSQDGVAQPGFELGYDRDTRSWTFRTPMSDIESLGSWKVSGASLVPDSWIHLIGVYDEVAATLSLYVNGDLIEDDVQAKHTAWDATGPLQIGRKIQPDGYTNFLKGSVADVKVYDRVVTEAEGQDVAGIQADQLAYWALNGATTGVSPDEQNGTGLTLGGSAAIYTPDESCDAELDPDCTPPAEPLWGDGHLALDGTGGYASRASGLLSKEDSFTLTARARLTAAGGADQTLLSLAGAKGTAVQVRYSGSADRWQLVATDQDSATATSTTLTGTGVQPSVEGDGDHLALVYSAVFGDVQLYVNGVLAGQAAWDNSWDFTTTSLQVGRALTGAAGSAYFAGAVDEVRVFQGALDASVIPTVAVLPDGASIEGTVA
ncbi:LamG-like jellyroll fold domain-containing protein [Streptomyces sp. NPDC008150]|uniref:LamG-like jellyroll fold domain-containing protein n=1 Tax=Streptomyces sp. NPDC008150 TaxID=3364816 RepID=UPI0036EFBCE5